MLEPGVRSDFTHGTDNSSDQTITATNSHNDRLRDCLRRAREGDGSAFTELMGDYHVPLCNYLTRLAGSHELGSDLAQETLIRAWTSLPELREEQHFKAWLYRIATNLARSHLRRARLVRWLPWPQTEEETSSQALSIEGPETRVSEADVINNTLSRLSPQYRTCLLLQIVGGFSQRDIALMLGISEKGVSSNVCRAREQFRQIYASLKGDTE
jgi:RNA polymerase sigma-70 factor, ECF subfamily